MTTRQTIVLVDDDWNILTSVSMGLEAEGFLVESFTDSEKALQRLLAKDPDLVVLDIKMPRLDGMELLSRLREKSSVPVIFLTSKDEEEDEFTGLQLGADDYIKKPFSQRLLVERIRALLRREAMRKEKPVESHLFRKGDLVLDDDRHRCLWKEKEVDLTVTEYLITKSLAQNPGHVKNREQLMNFAYGENIYPDDRTVDSHIKRLRKKFKAVDEDFDGIETVYGLGYRYKEE